MPSQKGVSNDNKQDGRRASSSSLLGGGAAAGVAAGTARSTSFRANSYEASIGGVIASCRRRGGINNMLKTLGISKVEPNRNMPHVNVGRVNSGSLHGRAGGADVVGEQASQRVLGVSLLGACSSKGCPTKSVENEDRYVHGKTNLDLGSLLGLREKGGGQTRGAKKGAAARSDSTAPCWGFATVDGHAGPACAHFLRENFMDHLRKIADLRKMAAVAEASAPDVAEGNADAAAGRAEGPRRPPATDEDNANDNDGGGGGGGGGGSGDEDDDEEGASARRRAAVEVVLARLLTDTLASLTRAFEKGALIAGEISGACVISGLYCEGALVLANVGDCQALYHGQVKSSPGAAVTAQTTIHDASNPSEVNRFLAAGGFLSSTGRFQGVLEPSRTVGDVDVKADAPRGAIASYPELFKVDIASDVFEGEERLPVPPFLVLATDGIWDETSANTVVEEVKDGIAKIQAHKRRFAVSEGHRRDLSLGSTTFTDGESDSEDEESEFCGSGEWAEQGMDLAERVVSLSRGRYDDATALVVVFE